MQAIAQLENSPQPLRGVFQRNTPDHTVNFIPKREEILSQVASILACYASYYCLFHLPPFYGTLSMTRIESSARTAR